MDITLIPGDYLIDGNGHHIVDCQGYATECTTAVTVTIQSRADYERIWAIIQDERAARDLNPNG